MLNKNDLIVGILLTILGIVIMTLPIFNVTNFKLTEQIVIIVSAILNLIRYIFIKEKKDKEGLYTTLAMLILLILTLFKLSNNLNIALSIFAYVIFISFIKLNKADFYHDRKNKMWLFEIISLIIFIILGFLTSVYVVLKLNPIAMYGILLLFNGFLELADPIIAYIKK